MNIEQKNTLFVSLLILFVVASMTSIAVKLVNDHIQQEVSDDLGDVFNQARKFLHQDYALLDSQVSHLLEVSAFRQLLAQRQNADIKALLIKHMGHSHSDVVAYYYYRDGKLDTVGTAMRSDLAAKRALLSNDFKRIVRETFESGVQQESFLFVYDEIIHAAVVPVKGADQAVQGVLIQGKAMDASTLNSLKSEQGVDMILYRPNLVIANTRPEFSYQVERLSRDVDVNGGAVQRVDIAGSDYFVKKFSLNDKAKLFMLVSVATEHETKVYEDMFINASYAGLVVMLIAALIGIQISRSSLAKPIKSLAAVSHAIGKGDMNIDVMHRNRRDELGELANSLEEMRANIDHMQKQEVTIRDRMSDFADISSDWLWETNAQEQFTYVSPSVSQSIGYSAEQLLNKKISEIFIQDNMQELARRIAGEGKTHKGFKNLESWLTTMHGYRICVRFNATPYFETGEFKGYRGTASDITKTKNDEDRLMRLANKDHLTGLSNRKRFMEDLAREINISTRQGTKGALLLIDLDHFKLINDTAGHAAGDEVIVQVSGLLRKLARNVDLVARLSGDEFVIALINVDANIIDERINEIVAKINQLKPMYSGKMMNTSASVGVAIFPQHADNAVELLARADTAMYMAKSEGRNKAHIYKPGDKQQEKMGSDLIWKDRIHNALENERFILAFQPIKPTTGESPSRYEVLVRMRAGDDKVFYPGDFIPTAEQFGLIRELDTWVVRQAISVLANLPPSKSNVSFTVNLSGLSVGESAMFELIKSELEKTDLDRNRLVFEVTESAAFQDISRAIEFIDKVKQLGCRIALDDFGVGFSSFSYLKQLQADILKIDGSFIRDIDQSKDDQLFVKALVDVARGMGMMTVAEFVETEAVYEMVRSLGVDYVQGYYIGKPKLNYFTSASQEIRSVK